MLLADLDHVDGPRESRLVRVRRVTADDGHAPRGIEPALGVVVHVLAAHDPILPPAADTGPGSLRRATRRAADVPQEEQQEPIFPDTCVTPVVALTCGFMGTPW